LPKSIYSFPLKIIYKADTKKQSIAFMQVEGIDRVDYFKKTDSTQAGWGRTKGQSTPGNG
jgi:hypothetical protein